jgi:cathepsin B
MSISSHPTRTILDIDSTARNFHMGLRTVPEDQRYIDRHLEKTFDGEKFWGGLIPPVMDQGKCGSSWASAAVTALACRINISTKGIVRVQLSAIKLLLCDTDSGCRSNMLQDAWLYLMQHGTCSTTCVPYTLEPLIAKLETTTTSPVENPNPSCTQIPLADATMCINGTHEPTFRAKDFYTVPSDTSSIQRELYQHGPISAVMRIYADFYTFDPLTEVYSHTGSRYRHRHPYDEGVNHGRYLGSTESYDGHAVVITGWGESDLLGAYWQIQNSFGPNWGMRGYFRIRRGTDECGIESNIVVGQPELYSRMGGMWFKGRGDIAFGRGIKPTTAYMKEWYSLVPHAGEQDGSHLAHTPASWLPMPATSPQDPKTPARSTLDNVKYALRDEPPLQAGSHRGAIPMLVMLCFLLLLLMGVVIVRRR